MSAEAPGERLRRLRRADSQAKAAQVRAAPDAIVTADGRLTVSRVARRAKVSRRFVYDHPELRAEIDLKAAETVAHFSGRLMRSAAVTWASLRADLEDTQSRDPAPAPGGRDRARRQRGPPRRDGVARPAGETSGNRRRAHRGVASRRR